VSVVRSMWW